MTKQKKTQDFSIQLYFFPASFENLMCKDKQKEKKGKIQSIC